MVPLDLPAPEVPVRSPPHPRCRSRRRHPDPGCPTVGPAPPWRLRAEASGRPRGSPGGGGRPPELLLWARGVSPTRAAALRALLGPPGLLGRGGAGGHGAPAGTRRGGERPAVQRRFGITRPTLTRWLRYFREHFPQTLAWRRVAGRLWPPVQSDGLVRDLLSRFVRARGDPEQGLVACLVALGSRGR